MERDLKGRVRAEKGGGGEGKGGGEIPPSSSSSLGETPGLLPYQML